MARSQNNSDSKSLDQARPKHGRRTVETLRPQTAHRVDAAIESHPRVGSGRRASRAILVGARKAVRTSEPSSLN